MIGRTHRTALATGIVVLAAAMSAPAQTSSTSRSSSTLSTSPAARPLGALAWIEQTRTRLGTVEPARKPGAADVAPAASMSAATTARRAKPGGQLGGGPSAPAPLWQTKGGGMGRGGRASTFGQIGGK